MLAPPPPVPLPPLLLRGVCEQEKESSLLSTRPQSLLDQINVGLY